MCSVIRRQAKVETQDFASHKQGYAIGWGDYMSVIAALVACEMKGYAIDWGDKMAVVAEFVACEMKGCAIGWGDKMSVVGEFVARETQNFASLLADAIIISNSKCVL